MNKRTQKTYCRKGLTAQLRRSDVRSLYNKTDRNPPGSIYRFRIKSNSRPAWSVILEIKPKCDQK